jgi:hypothetical protein
VSTLDVLRAAREYISAPSRWAQGWYDEGGAVCAIGAVNVAMGRQPDCNEISEAEEALRSAVSGDSVVDFNDSHTHAEVLTLFDRAIAIEEAKAAEITAASQPAPLVAA